MALVNPLGALGLEGTLQKIAQFLQQIAGNLGKMYPDTSGRIRANIETGTLTSVTTVTNLTQQSGYSTAYDQYSQMQSCANSVRAQIKVS